jgi:hypothetical protein
MSIQEATAAVDGDRLNAGEADAISKPVAAN